MADIRLEDGMVKPNGPETKTMTIYRLTATVGQLHRAWFCLGGKQSIKILIKLFDEMNRFFGECVVEYELAEADVPVIDLSDFRMDTLYVAKQEDVENG